MSKDKDKLWENRVVWYLNPGGLYLALVTHYEARSVLTIYFDEDNHHSQV
jgi:hypothetical protein